MKSPADYETAVKASGFGRFNILLLLASCPAVMSSVMETAVISFILPSAECDLDLDLVDKGILNAISYCGRYELNLIHNAFLQKFYFLFHKA